MLRQNGLTYVGLFRSYTVRYGDIQRTSTLSLRSAGSTEVTIELIQKRVGEQFGMRDQDLKVRSNTKAISFPRQIAMYLVKQLTSASLPEIGRQFGGKHHTTVLHSINKIEMLRRTDKDLNRTISRLMDSFS